MDRTFFFVVRTTAVLLFTTISRDIISEPKGYPDLVELRIVDMYTACTHPVVKDIILKQFQQPQSVLHVIEVTVAFEMVSIAQMCGA